MLPIRRILSGHLLDVSRVSSSSVEGLGPRVGPTPPTSLTHSRHIGMSHCTDPDIRALLGMPRSSCQPFCQAPPAAPRRLCHPLGALPAACPLERADLPHTLLSSCLCDPSLFCRHTFLAESGIDQRGLGCGVRRGFARSEGASNLEPMVRAALRYVRDVRDAECSSEAECRRVKMKVELETVVRAVVLAESQ